MTQVMAVVLLCESSVCSVAIFCFFIFLFVHAPYCIISVNIKARKLDGSLVSFTIMADCFTHWIRHKSIESIQLSTKLWHKPMEIVYPSGIHNVTLLNFRNWELYPPPHRYGHLWYGRTTPSSCRVILVEIEVFREKNLNQLSQIQRFE